MSDDPTNSVIALKNVPITVFLYNGPLLCGFNVPVEGLAKLDPYYQQWLWDHVIKFWSKIHTNWSKHATKYS